MVATESIASAAPIAGLVGTVTPFASSCHWSRRNHNGGVSGRRLVRLGQWSRMTPDQPVRWISRWVTRGGRSFVVVSASEWLPVGVGILGGVVGELGHFRSVGLHAVDVPLVGAE